MSRKAMVTAIISTAVLTCRRLTTQICVQRCTETMIKLTLNNVAITQHFLIINGFIMLSVN